MTPMKAIKAKCLDCCAGQLSEVKLCVLQTVRFIILGLGIILTLLSVNLQKNKNMSVASE